MSLAQLRLARTLIGLVLAGVVLGAALPARADDDRRDRREREFHERHDRGEHRGWRRERYDYDYVAPAPAYIPPPVVYAPPPAPAGLSLFFNFR
jgi:hypothetical protein